MSAAPRKQAPRLARPAARYWRGKAPKGVAELSDSEDEAEAGEQVDEEEGGDMPLGAVEGDVGEEGGEDENGSMMRAIPKALGGKMNITLRDVDIQEGKVIVAGREESGRTTMEEEESEEEDEEEETKPAASRTGVESDEYPFTRQSSDSESDSEEEEPQKPMFRPVFVPKRGRVTVQERDKELQDTEEALQRKLLEEEERRKQSHDMIAESIRRELAEKEKEKETPDIDDIDDLDPEGEFEAWRLRELSRIKRDKEAEAARDLEREEVERRRALPQAQRLQEDLAHAKSTRDSKPKGQQQFLQKYWHKGAFHQDADVLKRHDFTEKTESTMDVSLLPKVMQVRNFGKRSRTKYTHLVDQDTTAGNGGFGGTVQTIQDRWAQDLTTPLATIRRGHGDREMDESKNSVLGKTETVALHDVATVKEIGIQIAGSQITETEDNRMEAGE
ncbi:hypothetical protein EW145_g695 [Phellinidium pouzarii]|uniref:Micro-fibrillar-associated protein 1 C-terminal domain-containing protein n=1 Tax=Phellinidium pouzarii TaxID=167371 RepID=A0A4S4LJ81_9AGAM|nr:hypothetical protein EW145_g695 [Phellinidium pouzarii]